MESLLTPGKTMRGEIVQAVLKTSVPPRAAQGPSSPPSSSLQLVNDESLHLVMGTVMSEEVQMQMAMEASLKQTDQVQMQMALDASLKDDARVMADIKRLESRLAEYGHSADQTTPGDGSCLFHAIFRGLRIDFWH